MRGESYYLYLIGKDGTKYRTLNKPVTLLELDKHTTKYDNKKELIAAILKNTKSDLNYDDIASVKIYMEKKDGLKEEKGPLYKKDAIVTKPDAVMNKFELYSINRRFVLDFIKNYEDIPNFRSLVNEIRSEINNNVDYSEALYLLVGKIFKTYKGLRYTYLSMKAYDSKQKFTKASIESDTDVLTEDEIKIDELKYLIEHDRELLDLDDFNHHEELSIFDGTGYGRSR